MGPRRLGGELVDLGVERERRGGGGQHRYPGLDPIDIADLDMAAVDGTTLTMVAYDSFFVADGIFDASQGIYTCIEGPFNGARLPPFHQLDLRVDQTWIKDLWRFTLYLDVQNAYNNLQNVEFQNYSYNFQQDQPITGLPILPSLGLKAEF